jgi:hypothetical protein
MKRLDFPAATDTLDLYNLAYIGALNPEAKLSPAQLRTHSKLLDKLEAIGVAQTDGTGFKLPKDTASTVLLEESERDLLKQLCESFHWNPAASRRVVKLFDLLEGAPDYLVPAPDPAV